MAKTIYKVPSEEIENPADTTSPTLPDFPGVVLLITSFISGFTFASEYFEVSTKGVLEAPKSAAQPAPPPSLSSSPSLSSPKGFEMAAAADYVYYGALKSIRPPIKLLIVFT
jgi:hypothetical protein